MSRVKSAISLASSTLALAVVIEVALGPETLIRKADEALFVSWRTLGDHFVNRELDALARQLERKRLGAARIGALRDSLAARLMSLETCRDRMAEQVEERDRPRGTDPDRGLAHLNAAIALLRSAVARTDRVQNEARTGLSERESELIALRAAAEVRCLDRALEGPAGDPSLWYVRVARARDFLQMTVPGYQERVTHLEQACPQ